MKSRTLLIISILFGLLAALAVQYYLIHLSRDSQVLTMGEVVVARVEIPARTVLTLEMLDKTSFPADYLPTGTTNDPRSLVGSITLSPILKGEPVLKSSLASTESGENGLSFRVSPGKRAVSLAIDDVSGVSGMLLPGDRVDVFGTMDLPDPAAPTADRRVPAAVVAVYDVEVLAIGRTQVEVNTEGKNKSDEGKTATLAVPVEETQRLILLSDRGKARLVLRSPVDHERPLLPLFTLREYLK